MGSKSNSAHGHRDMSYDFACKGLPCDMLYRREKNKMGKKRRGSNLTKPDIKEMLIGKFGHFCWGCGFDASKHPHKTKSLTVDHITPEKDGGSMILGNAAILCHTCNSTKGWTLTLARLKAKNIRDGVCEKGDLVVDTLYAINWSTRARTRSLGPRASASVTVMNADGTIAENSPPPPPWWKEFDPDPQDTEMK